MYFIKKKRQGYILLEAALAMIVVGMLSTSIFTIFSGQFSMIQASRTALAAQQYAEIDANTLRLLSYDDLDSDSKGSHARQGITSVADSDGWQDEIVVGAEKTIDAATESKQRIATIKIYKTGDTLSRYSLEVPLSSQGSGTSGVPVGSIIVWSLDSLPSGSDTGKWLECNGQSVSATTYPKLAALMSNVPDYRGVFLRGYGAISQSDIYGPVLHESSDLGVLQGDSIRNISGKIDASSSPADIEAFGETYPGYLSITGPFEGIYSNIQAVSDAGSVAIRMTGFKFDASQSVPTSNENRPINIAVRYLIKAK